MYCWFDGAIPSFWWYVILYRSSHTPVTDYPSCTSTLAKWNIPMLKTKADVVDLKESVFIKPYFKKKSNT